MSYSLTTRIALVLALSVTGARPAGAADQTILGRQLVVKTPSGRRTAPASGSLWSRRGRSGARHQRYWQ
jgi:hypothetical protein